MKNNILLILIMSFVSCNSDKKISEINSSLIGFYECKTIEQSEKHFIIIDTLNRKYNGLYFGTEDSSGHGVFFYGNKMEDLKIDNKKISFQIGKRDLYETTRFRIVKHKRNLNKDSIIGISRSHLKYSGKIDSSGINLNCESEYEDCWSNKLLFEKVIE